MSEQHHEEAHTGPIKNPKHLLLAVFFSFVVPVFVIIGLVKFVTSSDTTGAGSSHAEMSKAVRLQKIGSVEIQDANRPLRSGEEVFKSQCSACHATGAAGAPKFQDTAAWGPRIKQSLETLVHSALSGKGAMAAQGGGEFNDTEIARGVVYMANAAGASFPEPQAPAAGAEAAPATAGADAGKNLYSTTCVACHGSGVAGAPKFGDKAAWAPFIAKGMDDMVQKAAQGVGAMPPKGGSTASDADFKAAIQYMVNAAK